MSTTELSKLQKDITMICDYLERDEKRHYEESDRPKDHIWCYIKRTRQWLRENKKVKAASNF